MCVTLRSRAFVLDQIRGGDQPPDLGRERQERGMGRLAMLCGASWPAALSDSQIADRVPGADRPADAHMAPVAELC